MRELGSLPVNRPPFMGRYHQWRRHPGTTLGLGGFVSFLNPDRGLGAAGLISILSDHYRLCISLGVLS